MASDYIVTLKNGTTITLENISSVEKDGSGRRFRDADGNVIAEFGDGEASSHYPASSSVVEPATVTEPDEAGGAA